MHAQKHHPIEASCAWKGAEMRNKTDWLRPFSTVELAEIDAALQSVKSRGLDLFDVGKEDFPLPGFSQGLAKISQQLETGSGMIMLRGLPLSYSPDDLQIVYWGMGTHLGTAVSQNKTGELFGNIERGTVRGGVPCREGWWRDVTQFRKNRTGIHAAKGVN